MNEGYETSGDNELFSLREYLIGQLSEIQKAILSSVKDIPEEEENRYNEISDNLRDLENEIENRGYHLNPDSDQYEEDF